MRAFSESTERKRSNLLQENHKRGRIARFHKNCKRTLSSLSRVRTLAMSLYSLQREKTYHREMFLRRNDGNTMSSRNRDTKRRQNHRDCLWEMTIDFTASKVRMKEITVRKRVPEWTTRFYFFNTIK